MPALTASHPVQRFRERLRRLYEGDTPRMQHFRDTLLAFDVAVLVFVVATSFASGASWVRR